MKIKMTETLGTPDGCLVRGTEYDLPEVQAHSYIGNGIAVAVDGGEPVPGSNTPQPQKMDAAVGKPVENVAAVKVTTGPEHGSGDAGKVQTAASVQAAETAARTATVHATVPAPKASATATVAPVVAKPAK